MSLKIKKGLRHHGRVMIDCGVGDDKENPKGKTLQSMKDLTNINLIMKRFEKTGQITHVNAVQALYGDFSEAKTYQESLNLVMEANDAFLALPAKIRAKFENNPELLVQFIENDANYEEAVKLGLMDKDAVIEAEKIKKLNAEQKEKHRIAKLKEDLKAAEAVDASKA
jgi:phage internal scaffolding protein